MSKSLTSFNYEIMGRNTDLTFCIRIQGKQTVPIVKNLYEYSMSYF